MVITGDLEYSSRFDFVQSKLKLARPNKIKMVRPRKLGIFDDLDYSEIGKLSFDNIPRSIS